jgi:hypothetical protein
MFPANAYTIRRVTDDDADTLRRLAELDSRPQLRGRVVIAEDNRAPVAALANEDRGTVAEPFRRTGIALALLHIRASALTSYERTPPLRDRIRAATRVAPHSALHARA